MRPVTFTNAEEEAARLPLREDFVRALTWLLEERQMSQREFADSMGWTSHTRLQPWLRLRAEPKPSEIFAIEKVLRVPSGTLSRHLGYLPLDARPTASSSVDDIIDGDPMLPDWGKRLLKANYWEIRKNHVHGGVTRRRRAN